MKTNLPEKDATPDGGQSLNTVSPAVAASPPPFTLGNGDSPIQAKKEEDDKGPFQMGAAPVQMKTPDPNKRWGTKQFFDGYEKDVSTDGLSQGEKQYFDDYAKAAQIYLNRPNQKWTGKTDMTGEMLSNGALRAYLKYNKDITKVIPVDFALAQAQQETHFNAKPRETSPTKHNPFNVGEFDSKSADWVTQIEDTEQGISMYYDLMAEDYLSHQNPEDLAKNMKNEIGNAYASHSYIAYMQAQAPFIKKYIIKNAGKMPDSSALSNANSSDGGKAKSAGSVVGKGSAKGSGAPTPTPVANTTRQNGTVVNANKLNVRSGPGPDNSKVGEALIGGAEVTIFETSSNGWHRIGQGKWVSGKYIEIGAKSSKPTSKTGSVVNASKLNVRSGPGPDNSAVGPQLEGGASVTIYETAANGWHRIGDGKWVSGKFIQVGQGGSADTGSKEAAPKPKVNTEMQSIARQVYNAMDGLGTTESKVYSGLAKLNNDATRIAEFKRVYQELYGHDVEVDIRGDFSNNFFGGNELDKALGYLNVAGGQSAKAAVAAAAGSKEQSSEAKGLKAIIDKKDSDFTAKDGKGKMRKIIEYAQKQYKEYPPKVKAFKAQKGLTPDQKVATLGKMAVEVAKMQFYIGAVFYEGGKWEQKVNADGTFTKSSNRGEMVDHITSQSSYNGKATGGPWCTKFATYAMSAVLGTRADHSNDGESRRGVWGGSQMSNGYEQFWSHDKKDGGRFTGQTKRGGSNPFAKLKTTVSGKKTKAEKIAAVRSFFSTNFTPQPGDIMITGDGANNFKYSKHKNFDSSHTTMVEKVDISDKGAYIYTIEGNAGDRVAGKRYDLTATSGTYTLANIVNIQRKALEHHGQSMKIGDQVDIKALKGNPTFDESTLLTPLTQMTGLLKDYAAAEGRINKTGSSIYAQDKGSSSTKTN